MREPNQEHRFADQHGAEGDEHGARQPEGREKAEREDGNDHELHQCLQRQETRVVEHPQRAMGGNGGQQQHAQPDAKDRDARAIDVGEEQAEEIVRGDPQHA